MSVAETRFYFFCCRMPFHYDSVRATDFARTKATRANMYRFGSAVYNSLHSTNIGLPNSVGFAVRMRDGLSESNALSANFAFCHA